MSKIRISLSDKDGELKGQIETPGDPAFVLEAMTLVVETISQKWEVPINQVLEDIWKLHVKTTRDL